MAAGYPVKVNYLTGDVLTAANLNDLAGTVNLYDPTAKGDLFPATAADAVSRLAVGANDTVLTADSTTATGLKWAAPAAGGGMTQLATGSMAGVASLSITSISQSYKSLYLVVKNFYAGVSNNLRVFTSGYTGATATFSVVENLMDNNTVSSVGANGDGLARSGTLTANIDNLGFLAVIFQDYANTTTYKGATYNCVMKSSAGNYLSVGSGFVNKLDGVTSIGLQLGSGSVGNWTAGTYTLFGVN